MSKASERVLAWLPSAVAIGGGSTSLAYYFGWIYLKEQYHQYGTTVAVVGYARSEIVFRSLSVFVPAATRWMGLVISLWAGLHALRSAARRLTPFINSTRAHRMTFFGMAATLCLAAAVTVPDFNLIEQGRQSERWLGLAGLAYVSLWVASEQYLASAVSHSSDAMARRHVTVLRVTATVGLALSVLFVARAVAVDAGIRSACQFEVDKHILGESTLVSNVELGLSAPTFNIPFETFERVTGDELSTNGRPYVRELEAGGPYEYGGLRILTRAGGRLWVFPAAGTPRRGLVGISEEGVLSISTRPSNPVQVASTPVCARLYGEGAAVRDS